MILFCLLLFFRAQLDTKPVHSDDSDDEAPNGGDYTVYECPGLAPVSYFNIKIFFQIIFFLDGWNGSAQSTIYWAGFILNFIKFDFSSNNQQSLSSIINSKSIIIPTQRKILIIRRCISLHILPVSLFGDRFFSFAFSLLSHSNVYEEKFQLIIFIFHLWITETVTHFSPSLRKSIIKLSDHHIQLIPYVHFIWFLIIYNAI